MSRIGKLPIVIPEGVTINIDKNNVVTVKGKLGELVQEVNPDIIVSVEDKEVLVKRPSDQKRHKALHGLYRSLLYNMVKGVSEGYEIKQELVGVGFRAEAKGQVLELNIGYSHDIHLRLPNEIQVEA
ncbi:MAG: 50S ribosomal protein L6, partial [bacterium]